MLYQQIKVKIASAFDKIGNSNGTAMPFTGDNSGKDAAAHEYFVAKQLKAAAEKREEKAKAEARKHGLLGDEATYKPSTDAVIQFENKYLSLASKTNNPASRLDESKLRTAMAKAGLKQGDIQRIISAGQVENKPATSFIFAIAPEYE